MTSRSQNATAEQLPHVLDAPSGPGVESSRRRAATVRASDVCNVLRTFLALGMDDDDTRTTARQAVARVAAMLDDAGLPADLLSEHTERLTADASVEDYLRVANALWRVAKLHGASLMSGRPADDDAAAVFMRAVEPTTRGPSFGPYHF